MKVKTISPLLVKTDALFAVNAHSEDAWGNITRDIAKHVWHLEISEQANPWQCYNAKTVHCSS